MKTLQKLLMTGVLATLAFAADVDGTWKAKYESPDGQTRESTFVLKAEGEKLTGTMKSGMGDAQIQDGTIKGSDIAFSVLRNFGGNEVQFKYAGTITGTTMKLKATAGDRQMDITATKQ
ncbi:MAG TPA: hypothetical protein VER03_09395 [Bryobacteraceae bacterium]|nr:hypothetical protein [Bryobacteraceae bacterium]